MLDEGININPRKIIAWFVASVVAIFALVWVYNYLTTGQVTVTTDGSKNYVKIEGVLGEKNGKFSKQAQHKLHVRVKPGKYEISVYDEHLANGSRRLITVRARQSQSFNMNPSKMEGTEPVYGKEVSSVSADNSRLFFIDKATGSLQMVDSNGNVSMLSSQAFVEVKWASPGLGIAQANNNSLYLIKNGSVTALQLPFKIASGDIPAYDISKDGQIYVALGGKVYSGSGSGTFKNIYSSDNHNLAISAGPNSVAVLEKAPVAAADENSSSKDQAAGHLVVVSDSGKISADISGADSVAWSPNGKYLLVTGRSDTKVFDDKLHVIRSLFINNAYLYTWLDDSTLLYGIGNAGGQLWAYDIGSQRSHEVALLQPTDSIRAIYPDQDGSYAYISSQSNQNTQLLRVPLKGQPINKTLTTLNIFLPEDVGVCTLNYINFTKPVIAISYPEAETAPELCVQAAKGELRYYNLDPNSFSFTTTAYDRV